MGHFGAKWDDNVHSFCDMYEINYFALKNYFDYLDHLADYNCDFPYV